MIDEVKTLLGNAAANFTDQQIGLALKYAQNEIKDYCNVNALDLVLESVSAKIAVINLNRTNTEGLASQSYSGVSESYINGYPAEILSILNKKRKIKTL